jgi:hypothetical protein
MQRGEMFGPPGIAVVSAFDRLRPLEFRDRRPSLPVALRNRIPIWFEWFPEDSVLYVQSNFVQDYRGTRFNAVVDSLFALADSVPVRRLVLDLRYNSGGDGSKLMPFIHAIIRRPRLDEPGRLVVLTGPKTFSAAVLWLSLLREHTHVVSVGEPAGAARNHSGDAEQFVLPRTGLVLQVSTLRHYGTRSDDTAHAELPDFPVASLASDYFAGRDPALEFARHATDLRSIPALALGASLDVAIEEAEHRSARFGGISGWRVFAEDEMNSAGYTALAQQRPADALRLFAWNASEYPCSSNVWDSYGEALLAGGDSSAALASYRHAAELDPGNEHARSVVTILGPGRAAQLATDLPACVRPTRHP